MSGTCSFRRGSGRSGRRLCGASTAQPFQGLVAETPWVKTDLFRWNQSATAAQDADNYEAALGLFLLIEHRQGCANIPSLIAALSPLRRPDGPAILKLFQDQMGLDLRRDSAGANSVTSSFKKG